GEKIDFTALAFHGEGSTDQNPTASHVDQTPEQTASAALNKDVPDKLKTVIPTFVTAAGEPFTFFTGYGGSPSSADPHTTNVQIALNADFTTAEIAESVPKNSNACKPAPFPCFRSELTIPGDGAKPRTLQVILQRHFSTLGRNFDINKAGVYYSHDPLATPVRLKGCVFTNDIAPCILNGPMYDGSGNVIIEVTVDENGSFNLF
ncbi:MAG: hypothetical protein ABIO45_07900, partial [Burkholderiaceae bacterium]